MPTVARKTECPQCGDANYRSDPVCLSCGAQLLAPTARSGSRGESHPEGVGEPTASGAGPGFTERNGVLPDPADQSAEVRLAGGEPGREEAAARRERHVEELRVQVESLIEQGYHKLPRDPGEKYGPADDVSDLCREIGECYLRNREPGQAVRWFERALVIAPGNTPARAYLVGALCELGQCEEALACYEETPGDPIEKNVVRGWLELPEGREHDAQPVRPRSPRMDGRCARPISPSAERSLLIESEPRPAPRRRALHGR